MISNERQIAADSRIGALAVAENHKAACRDACYVAGDSYDPHDAISSVVKGSTTATNRTCRLASIAQKWADKNYQNCDELTNRRCTWNHRVCDRLCRPTSCSNIQVIRCLDQCPERWSDFDFLDSGSQIRPASTRSRFSYFLVDRLAFEQSVWLNPSQRPVKSGV